MSNIEIYAAAISASIANSSVGPAGITDSEHPDYCDAAAVIVEPVIEDNDAALEYADFLEEKIDNWANWIGQTYGADWGRVAKIVAEEGY